MVNEQKAFKILSIDGGGMKGIFSAKVLSRLENSLCGGESLAEYFDLICGTSTGALIALALSQKISCDEIVRFYEQYGREIFPRTLPIKTVLRILRGWVYSDKGLREALSTLFGDTRIGDSQNLLCIPAYCLTKGQPVIFKYDHKEGSLERDNKLRYVDVALATTAAPMFFPKHKIEDYHDYQFYDGGVFANNPAIIGLTEALQYFVGPGKEFHRLAILSVSSLNESSAEKPDLSRWSFVTRWSAHLSHAMMSGQSFAGAFMTEQLCKSLGFHYCRIPSDKIGCRQEKNVQLDAASPKALKLMAGKGDDQGLLYSKRDEVKLFFEHKKLYNIPER
jgi:patatin-like phospholipase/acyl hydrolase